jgi:gentisate 1,2-dioxygenase
MGPVADLSTPGQLADAASLEELYAALAKISVGAGWNKPTPSLWPSPRETFLPAHWRYDMAKGALDAAGRLINTELAERRNLILTNPLEGNGYATTKTIVAAYQMIMPGERARSHRHTPNALRLVLDALPGTYTVVNGKKLAMLPGDVVLTPNWSWHGHGNESRACGYWIDFLDVPFVQLLEPIFLENHPDAFEEDAEEVAASPFIFPWVETQQKLAEALDAGAEDWGARITLETAALDTIALHMIRLRAGRQSPGTKTTANNIYAVVEGEGESIIGGKRFAWARGDVVVAPAWQVHHHRASTDAVLFQVTDRPILEKTGLLREEAA